MERGKTGKSLYPIQFKILNDEEITVHTDDSNMPVKQVLYPQ